MLMHQKEDKMANIELLERATPVAPIKIAALEGCRELAEEVDRKLVKYRKDLSLRKTNITPGYCEKSFLVGCDITRFGTGEGKGYIQESVRGVDLFIMVDVTNTGKTAGKDVLELYIKDELVSIARPEIELKGFEKVYLEPGETKCVTFRLGEKELAYFNRDLDFAAEPGTFLVSVSDHGPEKEPGIRIELLPSK